MMRKKKFLSVVIDLCTIALALFLALSMQLYIQPFNLTLETWAFVTIVMAILVSNFYIYGAYHIIWQYAGAKDFLKVIAAVSGGNILIFIVTWLFMPHFFGLVLLPVWLFSLLLLGGRRFIQRITWNAYQAAPKNKKNKKALIIGAGEAGALTVRTLLFSKTPIDLNPVGFIDDDEDKAGLRLYGLRVLGNRKDIPLVTRRLGIKVAIIAIPSATLKEINAVVDICKQVGLQINILPNVLDIAQGRIMLNFMQQVKMEDLLHRDVISVAINKAGEYIKGKTVLVTGAGGSIGSELCRQICAFEPRILILLGRGENSIYEINQELSQKWRNFSCIPVINDIRDEDKLRETFQRYKPEVVFHAAAHKHVNLMQLHPEEAFKNNVFGSLNVARMSHDFAADIFVLISTDKAVNPSSIMGVTKLLAEMVTRYYAEKSKTKFLTVRFGNVLGSRGSVVHLFNKQIASGGPITITHPDMRRYFMTIGEAVKLVLQAGAMAKGGELFMLDMGEQIKIVDLACDMIRLYCLEPGEDIEIKYTGVKPGEKLSEELLTDKEKSHATEHNKIFVLESDIIDFELLNLIKSVHGFPKPDQVKKLKNLALKKFNLTELKM